MSEWILAIDYGTTYSSGVIAAEGRVEPVELDGSTRMPSMVLLSESGELVTGLAAERQLVLTPDRVERAPKRRLGDPVILLAEQPVRPVDAVAAVLRRIGTEALRLRGDVPPVEVRLTYPARWGERRLEVLREAARRAGLGEVVLIPEPVAAAVYFADHLQPQGSFVAVYDLGGGTFDTAVLRRVADGFEVVGAPGGDERLGGEDFDERLYQHLGARIAEIDGDAWEQLRFADERPWRRANQEFRSEVRRAKEALSLNSDYTVYVGAPADLELRVTRDEFEALISADVAKSVDELMSTIARAGVSRNQVASVYLAGGSSRIPLVSRQVGSRLGMVPETFGDPKLITAIGAARATNVSVSPVPVPSTEKGATRPPVMAGRPPVRADGYELLGELGSGGMGVVYLAVQSSLGRLVALKTLPTLAAHLADRLEREGQVLARLQHPRLATVIDVDRTDGTTNLVMPFFAGGSLQHSLVARGRLTPGQAVSAISTMAEALDACHRAGVLHRDVKPSNILLSTDGEAYLADFGLAHYEEATRLTPSNSAMGTTGYAAPEVLAGQECTTASDIYSLGACAYHALCGRGPVDGMNLFAAIDMVRNGTYPRLEDLAPDTPPALRALVEQAMSVDPAARPRDLRAFAAALRESAPAEPVPAAPPPDWARLAAGRSAVGPVVEDRTVEPAVPTTPVAPVAPPTVGPPVVEDRAAPPAPPLLQPVATIELPRRLAKAAQKVERNVAPSLQPGEVVEAVVPTLMAGPMLAMYPFFAAISVWFLRPCAVVVTNQRVLLMQGSHPASLATRKVRAAFPRSEVRVAPCRFGLVMLPTALVGTSTSAAFAVNRRFARLIDELARILGAVPATTAGTAPTVARETTPASLATPAPTSSAPSGGGGRPPERPTSDSPTNGRRRNLLIGAGTALALLLAGVVVAARRDGGADANATGDDTTSSSIAGDVVEVPAVTGLSEEAARAVIEALGLRARVAHLTPDDPMDAGLVFRQYPAPGDEIEPGTWVLLSVGLDPENTDVVTTDDTTVVETEPTGQTGTTRPRSTTTTTRPTTTTSTTSPPVNLAPEWNGNYDFTFHGYSTSYYLELPRSWFTDPEGGPVTWTYYQPPPPVNGTMDTYSCSNSAYVCWNYYPYDPEGDGWWVQFPSGYYDYFEIVGTDNTGQQTTISFGLYIEP